MAGAAQARGQAGVGCVGELARHFFVAAGFLAALPAGLFLDTAAFLGADSPFLTGVAGAAGAALAGTAFFVAAFFVASLGADLAALALGDAGGLAASLAVLGGGTGDVSRTGAGALATLAALPIFDATCNFLASTELGEAAFFIGLAFGLRAANPESRDCARALAVGAGDLRELALLARGVSLCSM